MNIFINDSVGILQSVKDDRIETNQTKLAVAKCSPRPMRTAGLN